MDYLPSDIEEDKKGPVWGRLLAWLIEKARANQWSTGWGLRSEKTADGGIIWLDRNVLPEQIDRQWRGRVTASSSSSEMHTIEQVDSNGTIVGPDKGGRKTTNAKAHNGRKGVPVGTNVMVEVAQDTDESGAPKCFFDIPDGLTISPKNLTSTSTSASGSSYDIEADSSAVEFDPSRVARSIEALFFFFRKVKADASGMITEVDSEEESFISGDTADSPKSNHITLENLTSGDADGKIIKINQPQSLDSTVTFTLFAADEITIDGSSLGSHTMTFDDSGRYRDGDKTIDFTVGVDLPTGSSYPSSVNVTVVTDVQVDESTLKLQKKTRTITVLAAGTESAWTDVHTGEECP